jgi:hypothetical protein
MTLLDFVGATLVVVAFRGTNPVSADHARIGVDRRPRRTDRELLGREVPKRGDRPL